MKRDIIKIIAVVLILESVYTIYIEYATFFPNILSIISLVIFPALMIIAGIGLFFKKEWSIVLFWIAFALPTIISLLERGFSINGLGSLISLANIGILIYLSNQKGKLTV